MSRLNQKAIAFPFHLYCTIISHTYLDMCLTFGCQKSDTAVTGHRLTMPLGTGAQHHHKECEGSLTVGWHREAPGNTPGALFLVALHLPLKLNTTLRKDTQLPPDDLPGSPQLDEADQTIE